MASVEEITVSDVLRMKAAVVPQVSFEIRFVPGNGADVQDAFIVVQTSPPLEIGTFGRFPDLKTAAASIKLKWPKAFCRVIQDGADSAMGSFNIENI